MDPYENSEPTEIPSEADKADWKVIKEDLEKLRADLTALGERSLAEGQDKLAEELAALRTKASELAARVNETGRTLHEDVLEYVRAHPITSISGAFGVGLMVSALMRRR